MSGTDRRLRDLLDTAVGEPPHRVNVDAVRRRVVRRRVLEGVAGTVAVAVIAVAIPVAAGALGHTSAAPRTQIQQAARGPVAYVGNGVTGAVTPIATGTDKVGRPIKIALNGLVITPDGKTVYVVSDKSDTVTPISTATNTSGRPIKVGSVPESMAITPDGRTLYVASINSATVTPIRTATNTAG